MINTARSTDTEPQAPILNTSRFSEIARLCNELNLALRRPSGKALRLIDKALSYLTPFESPLARTASMAEKKDLLDLLNTHRQLLSPYLDTDRIESNLIHNSKPY